MFVVFLIYLGRLAGVNVAKGRMSRCRNGCRVSLSTIPLRNKLFIVSSFIPGPPKAKAIQGRRTGLKNVPHSIDKSRGEIQTY